MWVWVSIYFRRVVRPLEPKTVMAIDLNFDNVTIAIFAISGRLVKLKRFKTPHRKVLTHRIWIERIQRRYPRSWKFIKGVRRAIERHGERIRSISWDYAHRVGNLIAKLALRYRSLVTLEDLEKIRRTVKEIGGSIRGSVCGSTVGYSSALSTRLGRGVSR